MCRAEFNIAAGDCCMLVTVCYTRKIASVTQKTIVNKGENTYCYTVTLVTLKNNIIYILGPYCMAFW